MLDEKEVMIENERVITRGVESTLSSIMQKQYIWESFFIPDG